MKLELKVAVMLAGERCRFGMLHRVRTSSHTSSEVETVTARIYVSGEGYKNVRNSFN